MPSTNSSNTSAMNVAQRPARNQPLRTSRTTIRKTAKKVAKKAAKKVVNGAVAQVSAQPQEMMILKLDGTENWPLNLKKSTCARIVYEDTVHKLERDIYLALLKTKKFCEKVVEARKSQVPAGQEACIVEFDVPCFMQDPTNPLEKYHAVKVQIWNYHAPQHVKVSWSPKPTTDPQAKKENRETIDYLKKNVETDESHRLAANHNKLLEENEKLRKDNNELMRNNQWLSSEKQQAEARVEELERALEATRLWQQDGDDEEYVHTFDNAADLRGAEEDDQQLVEMQDHVDFENHQHVEEQEEDGFENEHPEELQEGLNLENQEQDELQEVAAQQDPLALLREEKPLILLHGPRHQPVPEALRREEKPLILLNSHRPEQAPEALPREEKPLTLLNNGPRLQPVPEVLPREEKPFALLNAPRPVIQEDPEVQLVKVKTEPRH